MKSFYLSFLLASAVASSNLALAAQFAIKFDCALSAGPVNCEVLSQKFFESSIEFRRETDEEKADLVVELDVEQVGEGLKYKFVFDGAGDLPTYELIELGIGLYAEPTPAQETLLADLRGGIYPFLKVLPRDWADHEASPGQRYFSRLPGTLGHEAALEARGLIERARAERSVIDDKMLIVQMAGSSGKHGSVAAFALPPVSDNRTGQLEWELVPIAIEGQSSFSLSYLLNVQQPDSKSVEILRASKMFALEHAVNAYMKHRFAGIEFAYGVEVHTDVMDVTSHSAIGMVQLKW